MQLTSQNYVFTFETNNADGQLFPYPKTMRLNNARFQNYSDAYEDWEDFGQEYGLIRLEFSSAMDDLFIKVYNASTNVLLDTFSTGTQDKHALRIAGYYIIASSTITSDELDTLVEDNIFSFRTYSIEIQTFKLKCEKDVVNKLTTGNYNSSHIFYGSLLEPTSLLNPSIIVDMSDYKNQSITGMEFNYVYIPSLKRYYFVNDIISIRTNVFRIICHVDVLYSYRNSILLQNAYVTRYENSTSTDLVDDRQPREWVKKQTISNYTGGTLANFSFNLTNATSNVLMTSYSDYYHTSLNNIPSPVNTSVLPEIGVNSNYNQMFITTTVLKASHMLYNIFQDDSLSSYMVSCIVYPFDFSAITGFSGMTITTNFFVHDKAYKNDTDGFQSRTPDMSGFETFPLFATPQLPYLVLANFIYNPTNINKYWAYEPYAKYELWIPFVGWVTLNAIEILNQHIMVYYAVDIATGSATAYVRNLDLDVTLYSSTCQMGIIMPINTSNIRENTITKENAQLKFAINGVASGMSIALGALTENPMMMIGGLVGLGKSAVDYGTTQNMIVEKGQVSYASSDTSWFDDQTRVLLRVTLSEPINTSASEESIHAHLNGIPYQKNVTLSSLSGYCEIGRIHFTPTTAQSHITSQEIEEIENLLKNGVVMG